MSDVTFNMVENKMEVHSNNAEPWKVTLIDTGELTMTGGRLKRVKEYIKDDESFCFTYGDGLCDLNINDLIAFHKAEGRLATLTATRPPGRYGALKIVEDTRVERFQEKPDGDGSWINGGFFVLSPRVIDLIDDDNTSWESDPLNQLASTNQLSAYKHAGFWQAMDTLREKNLLENLWLSGKAPWKKW